MALPIDGTTTGSAGEVDNSAAGDRGLRGAEAFQASRRSAANVIDLESDDNDGDNNGDNDGNNNGDNDGDNGPSQRVLAPARHSKPKACGSSTQCGRPRGGAGEGLKRLLEDGVAQKEAWEEKRVKIEAAVQMHRIDSERAAAERVAEIQARSNEKIAEMQQETMRMQMQMMEGFFKVMQGRGNPA